MLGRLGRLEPFFGETERVKRERRERQRRERREREKRLRLIARIGMYFCRDISRLNSKGTGSLFPDVSLPVRTRLAAAVRARLEGFGGFG